MGKKYGGERDDELRKIIQVNDGFIIVGSTSSYGRGGWDVWLIKIDENGNEIWDKTCGTRDREFANAVVSDGSYYLIAGEKGGRISFQDGWIVRCGDYVPPKITLIRPQNYFYLLDREIFPTNSPFIIGGITVIAKIEYGEEMVDRVEFYLNGPNLYDLEPRKVVYESPYEWKWSSFAIGLGVERYRITVAARYGNAGAVAVDKIEVHIMNPFPAPAPSAAASLQK